MTHSPLTSASHRSPFRWLWVVFFFQGMSPGFWIPAITNVLQAEGLSSWVTVAFLVPPLCALVSPLIGGALADQRVSADRLFAWSSVVAGVFLFAAFSALQAGWNSWWFIGLLGCHSLAAGPQWGLLAVISLTHLKQGERQYPLVRLGATVGWVVAGLLTSFLLHADASPISGQAAAVARLVAAACAFRLPRTPPLDRSRSWKKLLGVGAFGLLKQRDHAVFFVTTALFSIPITAFYMYSAEHLRVLGDTHPTASMTVAQGSEIAAMLAIGSVMARFRVKTILAWALGLSVLRFLLSAQAGVTDNVWWHLSGIGLHGVCYTFYFITAQVFLERRVAPELRGQAQGLLMMISSGLGPLGGALFCGWLHRTVVTSPAVGWEWFWAVLAGIIAVCFAGFVLLYRGLKAEP